MTLEEAINHCEGVAQTKEREAKKNRNHGGWAYDDEAKKCSDCAAEHKQLVEWLKELKKLRERNVPDTNVGDMISRQAAINVALDFFIEFLGDAFHENSQNELIARFQRLPSAQPEIIRCKDCKYYKKDHGWNCIEYTVCAISPIHKVIRKPDDYCSRAEGEKMKDPIERQAVIEINRSYHGQMPNEVNHRIWKEIKELPSAQPEQRWIPCSERLPEEPFGCLVTVWDTNPVTMDEFENILPYFVGWDGEQWNDADGEQCPFEVIAWMPLPEPYRGEGNE